MSDLIEDSTGVDTIWDTANQNVCRVCYGNEEEEVLLAPCKCLGTVKYIHESCLLKWLKSREPQCEICHMNYQFHRELRPHSQRKWPNIGSWHLASIVKELVLLDWFHFLETVICCVVLVLINRMSSFDVVYQFALIALFELFYYGLNIFSCFYLLYYQRWSQLNLIVRILNHDKNQPRDYRLATFLYAGLENYAILLRKNRRLRLVVNAIEEVDV